MNLILTAFAALMVLALVGSDSVSLAETAPQGGTGAAKPISAELARKCQALAIKAHPTRPPGSRYGSAEAQRQYFQECVAKGGKVEN
jgi:hypothetical protein